MWAEELAEDTTSAEDATSGEKERFLSVMPVPGEKFHGLAKNFFGPLGERGFPSPYPLAH